MSEEERINMANTVNEHDVKCCRCFKPLGNSWGERSTTFDGHLTCCSQSTTKMFGQHKGEYFKHPAFIDKTGFQNVYIKWGVDEKYKLCWECHNEFLKLVGDFLLPKGDLD